MQSGLSGVGVKSKVATALTSVALALPLPLPLPLLELCEAAAEAEAEAVAEAVAEGLVGELGSRGDRGGDAAFTATDTPRMREGTRKHEESKKRRKAKGSGEESERYMSLRESDLQNT
jgi:hypothetical protein